jgi:hypothetical protein
MAVTVSPCFDRPTSRAYLAKNKIKLLLIMYFSLNEKTGPSTQRKYLQMNMKIDPVVSLLFII